MSLLRASCVLLSWFALCTSRTLHAQAHSPMPEAPGVQYAPQDWQVMKDMDGSNPCMRRDRFVIPASGVNLKWGPAALAICVGRLRSRVIAQAWATGFDEHGVQLSAAARAKKLAEMELWLRRLPGKFRIDGTYTNSGGSSPASGTANCFGVGDGPGVSCVVAATWKAPKQSLGKNPGFDKALDSAFQPVVLLFGIDPDTLEIRVTLYDFRAVPLRGFLVNGAVILEDRSPPQRLLVAAQLFVGEGISSATYSWLGTRVAVTSGGGLDMKFLLGAAELDLQLHREPQVDTARPTGEHKPGRID